MPRLILNKGIIHSKVHGHWLSTDRTTGKQVGWDAKTMGSLHHALYGILVSVHFLMAWNRALEFTKIALYLEYAILGKTGKHKLAVTVCRDYEIRLVFDEFQQIAVQRCPSRFIAAEPDMPRPECPAFLFSWKRIKPSAI